MSDITGEFERLRRARLDDSGLRDQVERLRGLQEQLVATLNRRYPGGSASGRVQAEMTPVGEVVGVEIDPALTLRPKAEELAREIREAVTAAALATQEQMTADLTARFGIRLPSGNDAAAAVADSAAARNTAMDGLRRQFPDLAADLESAQAAAEEAQRRSFDATAGAVTITLSGSGQLVDLTIDGVTLRDVDNATLAADVIAAHADAREQIAAAQASAASFAADAGAEAALNQQRALDALDQARRILRSI